MAIVVVACAFSFAWKHTGLSAWAERKARAALGRETQGAGAEPDELDAQLWEQALRYWESFEVDDPDVAQVRALGIMSYVPLDNLASIEGRVTGRRPSRDEVLDGLRQLNAVLMRYPTRFLRETGFERLVWLCDVTKDGARVDGFAMPAAKALVLDPLRFDPNIFHHEIFHMVDYRLHGDLTNQPAWDGLNPPNAAYIGSAAYADELRRGQGLGHSSPYFITDYARATSAEDRAETFRVLMNEPVLANERKAESSVIAAKAQYILHALDELAGGSSVALSLR